AICFTFRCSRANHRKRASRGENRREIRRLPRQRLQRVRLRERARSRRQIYRTLRAKWNGDTSASSRICNIRRGRRRRKRRSRCARGQKLGGMIHARAGRGRSTKNATGREKKEVRT